MRKEIDLNTWDRKEHFEFFSRNATPHYCVAFNIDVTNLLHFTRANKLSFYYSLVYLCTQTVNEIDAFLMETEDNKVYAIDQRIASFIDLAKGSTVFHVVCLPQQQDIFAFCSRAREQSTNNPLTLQQSCQITDPKVIFSMARYDHLHQRKGLHRSKTKGRHRTHHRVGQVRTKGRQVHPQHDFGRKPPPNRRLPHWSICTKATKQN